MVIDYRALVRRVFNLPLRLLPLAITVQQIMGTMMKIPLSRTTVHTKLRGGVNK
jgi:hypothetical protein